MTSLHPLNLTVDMPLREGWDNTINAEAVEDGRK
jgi:hypothetical protein